MKHKNNIAVAIFLLLACFIAFSPSCNKNTFPATVWEDQSRGDSLSFIVMGDWGKYGGEAQQPVADQMDVYSRKFKVQFIITTGDNFYPSGVNSIYDAHWQESFEKVYSKEGHHVPWYPTLGNHDYGGNPDAQVQYSGVSKRWRMPARFYSVTRKIDSTHSALFALTDTNPFVTTYNPDAEAQRKWLHETLSSSKERWKIAVGHHPVYSTGPHGNTSVLIEKFKPVFLQTKTDFYICGHDHILEYSVYPNESVHYLISGGGSQNYSVSSNSYTYFAKATPGFLVMTLYASRANFYFISHKGQLLYQGQVNK